MKDFNNIKMKLASCNTNFRKQVSISATAIGERFLTENLYDSCNEPIKMSTKIPVNHNRKVVIANFFVLTLCEYEKIIMKIREAQSYIWQKVFHRTAALNF